jgi:hypothetical protein
VEKSPLIFIDEDLKAEKNAMYSRKIAYLYSKRSGKPNWRAKSGSNRCWDEEEAGTFAMLPVNFLSRCKMYNAVNRPYDVNMDLRCAIAHSLRRIFINPDWPDCFPFFFQIPVDAPWLNLDLRHVPSGMISCSWTSRKRP